MYKRQAKELLHAGKCSLEELPQRCGFASRSAFYASFSKIVGLSPLRFLARERNNSLLEMCIRDSYYPDHEGYFIVFVFSENTYGKEIQEHILLLSVTLVVIRCV